MFRKLNRLLSLLALLAVFAWMGCASQHRKELQTCRYQLKTLKFAGFGGSGTRWNVSVSMYNPNAHPVTLNRVRFAVLNENDTLLQGVNPVKKVVPARDSLLVQTTLDVPMDIWQRIPVGIWKNTNAAFTLSADAYIDTWIGEIVVPRALRQTIHVNMPQQFSKFRDLMANPLFSWPK